MFSFITSRRMCRLRGWPRGRRSGLRHVDGVVAEIRQLKVFQEQAAVGMGLRPCGGRPSAPVRPVPRESFPSSSKAPRHGSCASSLRACCMSSGLFAASVERHLVRAEGAFDRCRPLPSGRSSLWANAERSSASCGRVKPFARASFWIARISSTRVHGRGHLLVHGLRSWPSTKYGF